MTVSIATWNINSVRLRLGLVARLAAEHAPDIICLQEIKCAEAHFPAAALREIGYAHVALNGQKAYHGVAILSRLPFARVETVAFCGKGDARHVAASFPADAGHALAGVTLHNFYVPAGGDEPDPVLNEKFAHKLAFLDEMADWSRRPASGAGARMLVGDLNIAPLETDVWSHRQLLRVVSHTPVEVARLGAVQEAGGWVDVVRRIIPPREKLFTWWSYRAADWAAADRGRRLDHVWTDPALAGRVAGADVLRAARGWEKPSDHVPVIVRLNRD